MVYCLVTLMFMPALAIGGLITLNTTINTTVKTDLVHFEISITNAGHDVALIEQIASTWDNRQWKALQKPTHLPPSTSVSRSLEIPREVFPNGLYHPVFIIDYKDQAGRPVSALTYAEVRTGQISPGPLNVKTSDLVVDDDAVVHIEIKNQSNSIVSAKLNLLLPREISTEGQQAKISIDPLANHELAIGIKNVSAMMGRSYTGLVTVSYDFDDTRHSVISPFRLEVAKPTQSNLRYRTQILTILGLWLGVIIVKELAGVWSFRK